MTRRYGSGMSVEANIVSREKLDVLLVPANAVVNNGLLMIENEPRPPAQSRDWHSGNRLC